MSCNDAIGSFEHIAENYSAIVDTKAIHIYYERPHLWSLLPSNLSGLYVLDIGCGSGWYAEQLNKKGAKVSAIDASTKMIALTKNRLKDQGEFYVADLQGPLNFLSDTSFDLVIAPLVIHYIKEWGPFFFEIARVLKPGGQFILSTHQPQTEVDQFNLDNYFSKVLIEDNWPGVGDVRFYHHTLHELADSLYKAGFVIERLLEPQPLPELKAADPKIYENILKKPWFLFVRAKLLPR